MASASMAYQPARSEQSYADQANSLVESYARWDLFSGSVLVAHDGHPVFRKAFGPANREWDIPNAPDTKFRIASVTRQFTAAAVLRLVERGALKLDDPISQYYPGAPASWQMIGR
ncbi:MAG: serine hydrolase domain-containing protein [Bradyrhizobium sp.]|jgi:CubicO group peptidase (beta-lactamase class C family)